ncbi:MAG: crossover junction endodeoxyribonuclease RuvC [Myxococcales bacterium]|nr:crossover junction endodeoxyribonuclease RuvC [Myxococcales bacterium]
MLRILGIDPGSRVTGYALISCTGGRGAPTLRYVECGVLVTDAADPPERRLAEISRGVREVIEEFTPDVAAVEDIFYCKNVRSALVLAQARGAALVACGLAGVPVHAYAPAQVKRAVTGNGRAGKPQVAQLVAVLLGLRRMPRSDASDALAVAITHAHFARAEALIGAARAAS